MLILKNTTDTLKATTSAAADIDICVDGITMTDVATPVMDAPEPELTTMNTAATATIAAAAGASKKKNIKAITARNTHATVTSDILIFRDRSGTPYECKKATLAPGEQLDFTEGLGWFKTGADLAYLDRRVLLANDQSNSTVTPTEVAGFSLVTGLGTFRFKYYIRYQAGATTTGVRFSVNHAGTVSMFNAIMRHPTSLATAADANADQDIVTATGGLESIFAARAKSTAGWGTTLSVDTANADMLCIIEGIMTVTADGEIELWHGSEVAAASTTKAGSVLLLNKIG